MKNRKNRVIVTGVAGFIGSKLAYRLLLEGYSVIGIDNLSSGKIKNIPKGVKFLKLDLSKNKDLTKIPKNIKYIFHLAGQSSGEISYYDPLGDLEKNTISTINLINYGIKNNSKAIYFASSMSVYGENKKKFFSENDICKPLSNYGNSKLISEHYLKIYSKQLPYVNLRMFNVYGPGQDLNNLKQGMLSIYLAQALKNKKIIVKGSVNRRRDFIYIDDVVDCWLLAFKKRIKNISINVASGKSISVKHLLEVIKKNLPGSYYKITKGTPSDQFNVSANISLLKKILGKKKFVNLKSGLNKFIDLI